ncbi:MAG: S41 family peptidase [Bacteroidota bacterium]
MKKLFATAFRSVVMVITVLIFYAGTIFGQEDKPAYIPPSCVGKTISKMSPAEMIAQFHPAEKPNPPINREDQLKIFNTLVKIINEIYLYPDFRGLDWPAVVSEFRSKIEKGLGTEEYYKAMEEFIKRLGDKHSHFVSTVNAESVKAQLAGKSNFVGVGALLVTMEETKQVTVLAVIPGSPADQAGLLQHDVILDVDGMPMVRNDTTFILTRGPECTMATLTVRSPGKAPRKVNIVRARVTGSMPVYARLVPTTDGRRIGYIFLPTFLDLTVPGLVKKALEDFGPLEGLVLDNRMNGGGSVKALIPMLGYFTSGTVGHFVNRSTRRPLEITASAVHNSQEVPLVMLVGKNTVSYAEVFAGVLQDIGRAKIVGQPTAGRVETLYGYFFADSSEAWIAQERFEPLNSKKGWQGVGVMPDKEAHAQWDQFTFENDPVLAVALKMLRPQ